MTYSQKALQILADKYAAKWRADGRQGQEPTDEAIQEAFAGCAREPRPQEYPAIRAAIAKAVAS